MDLWLLKIDRRLRVVPVRVVPNVGPHDVLCQHRDPHFVNQEATNHDDNRIPDNEVSYSIQKLCPSAVRFLPGRDEEIAYVDLFLAHRARIDLPDHNPAPYTKVVRNVATLHFERFILGPFTGR